MRRLNRRTLPISARTSAKRDYQKGAATIMVAVLMVALLGFAALAVDVGAMYSEKAQLQNGADAAALAIAGDCANGSCGDSTATGSSFANWNANDGSSGATVTFPAATTVHVVTKARPAGSATDGFSLFFARVLGIDSTQIPATAEAVWGTPSKATTLPWTVSECVYKQYLSPSQLAQLQATGNFTGDPIPTHILLRYDTNAPTVSGCAAQNGYEPGGFGWLVTNTGCSANIDLALTVAGQPGNHFPNDPACATVLSHLLDEPALIPLFNSATGNGNNAVYSLVGFAAFKVTGYNFTGSGGVVDSLAPSCTGNCRGIQGYFLRFVSLQEGMTLSGGKPNYGGTGVVLTQ